MALDFFVLKSDREEAPEKHLKSWQYIADLEVKARYTP